MSAQSCSLDELIDGTRKEITDVLAVASYAYFVGRNGSCYLVKAPEPTSWQLENDEPPMMLWRGDPNL